MTFFVLPNTNQTPQRKPWKVQLGWSRGYDRGLASPILVNSFPTALTLRGLCV